MRVPTVNYERNRSLPETRAECCAVIHAKNQVENGSRQTVLLRQPQSIVQRSSDNDCRACRFQRLGDLHDDKRLVFNDEDAAAGQVQNHDTTSARRARPPCDRVVGEWRSVSARSKTPCASGGSSHQNSAGTWRGFSSAMPIEWRKCGGHGWYLERSSRRQHENFDGREDMRELRDGRLEGATHGP
jgi:hypothetical protein